jgi:putative oxidoreductase
VAYGDRVLRRYARRLLQTGDVLAPMVVRVAAGVVFVSFSFGKFLNHAAEAAAFDRYGIPAPDEMVYVVGALELLGGLALILGLGTRLVAIALGLNMIGAITTAGRIEGGPIHLGLAPALLVAMAFLLWTGAGARSVDRRLEARLSRS